MVFGCFQQWFAVVDRTGFGLTFNFFAGLFQQRLGDQFTIFDPLLSAGVVVVGLAVVAALGLIGRSGFVTMAAACLAVLVVLGAYAVIVFRNQALVWPAEGSLLVLLGCALAFVGGLLARR